MVPYIKRSSRVHKIISDGAAGLRRFLNAFRTPPAVHEMSHPLWITNRTDSELLRAIIIFERRAAAYDAADRRQWAKERRARAANESTLLALKQEVRRRQAL